MAPTLPSLDVRRLRSYVFRLPLFTRIVLTFIGIFWLLGLQTAWNIIQWGALVPKEVNLGTSMIFAYQKLISAPNGHYTWPQPSLQSLTCYGIIVYRLNTYPLIHRNLLHALFNALALVPLLERFEAEHGTLLTGAMFLGPLSTLPALGYLLIERGILRKNTPILGASIWVFVLLGSEGIKAFRANPYFAFVSSVSSYRIPTWTYPLVILLFTTALIPNVSLLGHLFGIGVGYIYGLGYLKILAPPEKVLRWIEGKLNLLGRLPHYVSIDQKTYGRYGVLPTASNATLASAGEGSVPVTYLGSTQRLGP